MAHTHYYKGGVAIPWICKLLSLVCLGLCHGCQALAPPYRGWCPHSVDRKCQSAFEKLRHLLTTTSVLVYPDFNWPFILDTDASGVGIGVILSQVDGEG